MKTYHINKHLSYEEVFAGFKSETNIRIKERYHALVLAYEGNTLKDIAVILKRSVKTIENWIKNWNKTGTKSLFPNFKKTGNYILEKEIWEEIISHCSNKNMTLYEIQEYVNQKYGINYSYKSIWYRLRHRLFGRKRPVKYGKPYPINIKRPDEAKEILKKT